MTWIRDVYIFMDFRGKELRKCNLESYLPLSLWLTLSTISLASHCSVASLELLLSWPFAVYQSSMAFTTLRLVSVLFLHCSWWLALSSSLSLLRWDTAVCNWAHGEFCNISRMYLYIYILSIAVHLNAVKFCVRAWEKCVVWLLCKPMVIGAIDLKSLYRGFLWALTNSRSYKFSRCSKWAEIDSIMNFEDECVVAPPFEHAQALKTHGCSLF